MQLKHELAYGDIPQKNGSKFYLLIKHKEILSSVSFI